MTLFRLSVLIFCLGMLANANAQEPDPLQLRGNPIAGKTKSAVCATCHGLDGNSTNSAWPKIAGLTPRYFISQLIEFQKGDKGTRYEPTMYAMTQNLTAQDMADLAAYYATQTMTIGATPADKVQLGQSLYRGGNLADGTPACAACHGATGVGNSLANFPRLSGQNSDYVISALHKFANNERSNDPNAIMRQISAKLNEKEIEAVANYVAGLH